MTCLPEHLSHPLYRYEQYLCGSVKAATRERAGVIVWRFLKLFEDRQAIAEFRPADLPRYRTMRRREGIYRQTINAEADSIRRFFAWTAENDQTSAVHPAWVRHRTTSRTRPAKAALACAA